MGVGKTIDQWFTLQLISHGELHLQITALDFGKGPDTPSPAKIKQVECDPKAERNFLVDGLIGSLGSVGGVGVKALGSVGGAGVKAVDSVGGVGAKAVNSVGGIFKRDDKARKSLDSSREGLKSKQTNDPVAAFVSKSGSLEVIGGIPGMKLISKRKNPWIVLDG